MTPGLDRSRWTKVKLGDVVRKVKTKVNPGDGSVSRYVAGEHMDTDELRISRWGEIGDGYLGPAFHALFKAGQVLYGSRRTYLRKVAFADFDGVCANTTFVLETRDDEVLLPELLPFVMSTEAFHAHSIAESKGSVNPYVNWPDIAKYEFDLPPIEEQKRMAPLLWAAERHRSAIRELSKSIETTSIALLSSLQPGGRKVRDVVKLARAGATPLRARKDYYGGDIPWLKSGEVIGPSISTSAEKITVLGLENSSAHLVPEGATCVAMYGDGKTRGSVGRISTPMATNQAVLALVANESLCDQEFLYLWMSSRSTPLREKSAGGAQKNLNKALVLSEPFPDVALGEQEVIVARYRFIDNARINVESELRHTTSLMRALLERLIGQEEQ